jgi:hypothetical protein
MNTQQWKLLKNIEASRHSVKGNPVRNALNQFVPLTLYQR